MLEGEKLNEIRLEGQSQYLIGSDENNVSITLNDEGVSACHAAIVVDKNEGLQFVDLNSE